ncbi:hypothetical protein KVR01_005466 [Diaporthe batatas]|uniref:uncharacterized protein n=1 Tax=Diaporthe batatas TaxID=748121 RepID=UPI001D04EE99|nr:uncharacterized protein KVR01_005466 [Diaporthe batatas]KAG8165191.1 hypothetical protein KVR01_005466 [Diaporthe batatas]
MKPTTVFILSAASLASAVDMSPYKAGVGVDEGFATFVEEYYRISEDKTATNTFTDFWTTDGELIIAGNTYKGYNAMLGVKQALLPVDGNKAWWHLIRGSEVVGEAADSKTYMANIVIQTIYTPGNCSQAYGNASFTLLKGDDGLPILTPHSQALTVYNLSVSTTASPTDIACTTS